MANTDMPGQTLTLPDGRTLCYASYGDLNASATVFVHHGLPGSRVQAQIFDHVARQQHIRIIGIDRPGLGYSTFKPKYQLLDWPADLLAVSDYLNIDRFAVLGISGGCPYALACLHQIPRTRCVGGGIVAGVYPGSLGYAGMEFISRLFFNIGAWSPWLVEKILDLLAGDVARDAEHPEKLEQSLAKEFEAAPERDRVIWDENRHGIKSMLVEDSRQAMRSGSRGAAWDTYLVSNNWGFKLEDISLEQRNLIMWHGALDVDWPVAMARKAHKLLAGAELRVSDVDGHLSVLFNTVQEVMDALSEMVSQ